MQNEYPTSLKVQRQQCSASLAVVLVTEVRQGFLNMRAPPGWHSLISAILGMCSPKGYGFSAVLVINRVSVLADFGHFGHN